MNRTLTWMLGFFVVGYALRRIQLDIRAHRGVRKMIPDSFGNYDMDGVSYDPLSKEVVVSGDGFAPDPQARNEHLVQELTDLHCPESSSTARSA